MPVEQQSGSQQQSPPQQSRKPEHLQPLQPLQHGPLLPPPPLQPHIAEQIAATNIQMAMIMVATTTETANKKNKKPMTTITAK